MDNTVVMVAREVVNRRGAAGVGEYLFTGECVMHAEFHIFHVILGLKHRSQY